MYVCMYVYVLCIGVHKSHNPLGYIYDCDIYRHKYESPLGRSFPIFEYFSKEHKVILRELKKTHISNRVLLIIARE